MVNYHVPSARRVPVVSGATFDAAIEAAIGRPLSDSERRRVASGGKREYLRHHIARLLGREPTDEELARATDAARPVIRTERS